RGVVVVQHENLVHRRLLRLRLGLDDGAGGRALIAAFLDATHLRSNIYPRLRHHDIGTTAVRESPFRCRNRLSPRYSTSRAHKVALCSPQRRDSQPHALQPGGEAKPSSASTTP